VFRDWQCHHLVAGAECRQEFQCRSESSFCLTCEAVTKCYVLHALANCACARSDDCRLPTRVVASSPVKGDISNRINNPGGTEKSPRQRTTKIAARSRCIETFAYSFGLLLVTVLPPFQIIKHLFF
jgi:hypothetical protein